MAPLNFELFIENAVCFELQVWQHATIDGKVL